MEKKSIKANLSEKISDILRQEILLNILPSGKHLAEGALADRFGVSRGPTREAFRILETEGFVEFLSNGRTIATGFTADDMEYYYNVRYFLESEAIKIILSKPEDDSYDAWVDELNGLLMQSKIYLEKNDLNRFTELDNDFHRSFLERAGVKMYLLIWNIMGKTNKSIMEVNRKHLLDHDLNNIKITYAFHDSILNGLKRHDLEYTLSNLHTHLKNGATTYSEIIETIHSLHPAKGDLGQAANDK